MFAVFCNKIAKIAIRVQSTRTRMAKIPAVAPVLTTYILYRLHMNADTIK